MGNNYILDDQGVPVKEPNLTKWAKWFEDDEVRRVAATDLDDDIRVSTVFLGIDHRFGGTGDPILYETMIFGGEHNDYQTRCCTKGEALKQHEEAVALVKGERAD